MKFLLTWLVRILFTLGLSLKSLGQDSDPNESLRKYNQARYEFEKYEQNHGHIFQSRNTSMHYLTWGNPKDLPVIWIHGSFTNSYEIKDVAEKIVQDGYYLIAIDYYGHGLTPIPEHEVSLYHVADDILDLMNHNAIEKAIIGGWSRGGYIASAFYDLYPDRVRGLILEDGGSVAANTHYQSLEDEALSDLVNEMFSDRVDYLKFDSEYEAYKAYYDSTDNGSQFELLAWITQDKGGCWTIGPGLEELFHMANPDQFLTTIKSPDNAPLFARSMALMEPSIIYRNLNVPMLILDPVSEKDLFPFEKENKILKNLHSEFITHKIYENTGHNIHYEKPEKFMEDVLLFLNRFK